MKKIVIMSLILITIICVMSNVYAAIICSVNIQTAKTEFKQDEEFVVDIRISNIQSERGIIAFSSTLEYDKSSLTMVKMEGKNGWATPSYNETEGTLVMERNGLTTKDETMFQITFKVKEQNDKNISIALKDIEVADGNERTKIGDTDENITIKQGDKNTDVGENKNPTENIAQTPATNTILNSNTEKNAVLKDNSIADTKIPKAGDSNMIFKVFILSIIIISTALCIKVKFMEK